MNGQERAFAIKSFDHELWSVLRSGFCLFDTDNEDAAHLTRSDAKTKRRPRGGDNDALQTLSSEVATWIVVREAEEALATCD